MEILAIIPARGGSKGLPNKNILPLAGHPLIAYSVKVAQQSKYITRTIVSTDSQKIAETGKKYGAEVPFMRPEEFATDTSRDFEVFEHAIDWLQQNEAYKPDIIVQLRPTSPIRLPQELDKAIELFIKSNSDSLRAVTPSPCTPYKMWVLNGEITPMDPLLKLEGVKEPFNEPRQHLPKVYWQTGTLDIFWTKTLVEKRSLTGDSILPFVIEEKYAIDIDDIMSFRRAEQIIKDSQISLFND